MQPAYQELDQRWRLLAPPDAAIVRVSDRGQAVQEVRALPGGSPVVLIGRRGLRAVARRTGVRVQREYVALPSLAQPVAVTQVGQPTLRWMTSNILTVPSGTARWHALYWLATRVIRAAPGLTTVAPVGDRILVGARP